ncbi:permease-like cell division protein FtsX, partial [Spongiactinospora gelatinilytica]
STRNSPVAGVAAWGVQVARRVPVPPPDGPWPATGEFRVELCGPMCPPPTREQRRAIEARLRAMPGVTAVRYWSKQEEYREFAQRVTNAEFLATVEVADMGESFRGELRPQVHPLAFVEEAERLPGVAAAYVERPGFWLGKADLAVLMCPKTPPLDPKDPCAGRQEVTDQEKDRIAQRLFETSGVGEVYFSDADHSRKVEEHAMVYSRRHRDDESRSVGFYVKLEDKAAAGAVERAVGRLPGVRRVMAVTR